jgi:phenylalanyl-tRNA synthetase beta chain
LAADQLPQEQLKLALGLHGRRQPPTWLDESGENLTFFDLKGTLESLLSGLGIEQVEYQPVEHESFHPGKCAALIVAGQRLGVFGEVHPLVAERYDFNEAPVVAGTFDLGSILDLVPSTRFVAPVPAYPPVLEDLALVVPESTMAAEVEQVIREAGADLVADVRLFDVYRGDQIGADRKSLAYSVVYQAADRTLTDEEVSGVRKRIVAALEDELEGQLRA